MAVAQWRIDVSLNSRLVSKTGKKKEIMRRQDRESD